MGCTTMALDHPPDEIENGLKSGSAVAGNDHTLKDTRKFPARYSSKLPERRLRPAKSHMLHRKHRTRVIAGSIPRSLSVATKFAPEMGSITLPPPIDGIPAKFFATVGLEPYPTVRAYAQTRLEILLVKEAEQRSGDGIYPRIDQQLLGGDRIFGRCEALRRILVEFILTVPPPPSLRHGRGDLHDQLSTSPDTRFAAAYLMTRFWFLCEVGDHTLEWNGTVVYGWQLAIACIALCVRVQRDSLPPLRPVTNKELILLAPRGIDMTVCDLEQAQRDILGAISYCLQGNTPQPFLEEVRCSLSTFQQLVAANSTDYLSKRFWARMFDALLQRDVLFAPISMLVAAVLVAVSPAESAPALREEICSESKMTKYEFDQVSAWFGGVEDNFV